MTVRHENPKYAPLSPCILASNYAKQATGKYPTRQQYNKASRRVEKSKFTLLKLTRIALELADIIREDERKQQRKQAKQLIQQIQLKINFQDYA